MSTAFVLDETEIGKCLDCDRTYYLLDEDHCWDCGTCFEHCDLQFHENEEQESVA